MKFPDGDFKRGRTIRCAMARHRKKGKMADPSYLVKDSRYAGEVRSIPIEPAAGGASVGVLNVAKELSRFNYRLYRMFGSFDVSITLEATSSASSANPYNVYALNPSWPYVQALRLARRAYYESIKDELAMGLKVARWHDFRITAGFAAAPAVVTSMQGVGWQAGTQGPSSPGVPTQDEFEDSVAYATDGTGYRFVVGRSTSPGDATLNVWTEYADARSVDNAPEDPNTEVAYDQFSTEINDSTAAEISGNGNQPPYGSELLVNGSGAWVKVGQLWRDASGNQSMSTGVFEAPLGLIVLERSNLEPGDGDNQPLRLTVKKGTTKGVSFHAY